MYFGSLGISLYLELFCFLSFLLFYVSLRNLCSGTCRKIRNLLVIPRSKLKSYYDRAFSISALKLWKDIPETIKCSVDLNACKRNLKTFLFNSMYIHDF